VQPSRVADLRYRPTNIYLKDSVIPPGLKRVAVLPITTVSATETFQAGADLLQQYLGPELEKTKHFDLVVISPVQLRQWTGKDHWRADEALPQDLFDKIREGCGCEGVFFAQLTSYHPYQPVAVGWKLRLVEVDGKETLWSADEVLDAGNAQVANAARYYSGRQIYNEGPLDDPSAILGSPSRFGQYTLSALLATLPAR
jgi:hypothetical protein